MRVWRPALVLLLVVLAGCSSRAGAGTPDDTVTLTIRHSRFVPSSLEVRPGSTVRIVVRNLDPIAHELIVGDQAVQDVHERGTETHHGERPGEVSVAAGAATETTYTFPASGPILLGCHLPGHWDYGMRGTVRVG